MIFCDISVDCFAPCLENDYWKLYRYTPIHSLQIGKFWNFRAWLSHTCYRLRAWVYKNALIWRQTPPHVGGSIIQEEIYLRQFFETSCNHMYQSNWNCRITHLWFLRDHRVQTWVSYVLLSIFSLILATNKMSRWYFWNAFV